MGRRNLERIWSRRSSLGSGSTATGIDPAWRLARAYWALPRTYIGSIRCWRVARSQAIVLLQKHSQISENTQRLLEKTQLQEPAEVRGKVIRPPGRLHRVAAGIMLAAGLPIAVLGWWMTSNGEVPETRPGNRVASCETVLVIESASDGGRIAPGAVLRTLAGEMKSLILNGRDQVVMNAGTRLSIGSLGKSTRAGCLLNLASGEVCVHVEHDGNPFEVQTIHGKVVITGTTFDIKVANEGTALVVTEGCVRFESDMGAVQVAAGQKSMIAESSTMPSPPAACDAVKLTAWATRSKIMPASASPRELAKLADEGTVPLSDPGHPIDLESLDYPQWREGKRDWFERQFPWIFGFQKTLVAISEQRRRTYDIPDYPELLSQTGDIWQIVYPERSYRVIPVIEPRSLSALARRYGLDETWCTQVAAWCGENHLGQRPAMALGMGALEEWLVKCRTAQRACAAITTWNLGADANINAVGKNCAEGYGHGQRRYSAESEGKHGTSG